MKCVGQKEPPKICVVVRKRPLSKKEKQSGDADIVETRGTQTIAVIETKYVHECMARVKVDLTKYIEEHHFNFDRAFGEAVTNEEVE